jgi:transglutaminase-like putative cysteine protease
VTYDQYTGRAMASSQTTSQRLDRREPLEGSMDTETSRKFSEFTVTLLAPSTSVIYAPDEPLTVSVPTVYDFRSGDRHDYGSLRPLTPIHEQQRYSVLASVSTASAAELRQSGNQYPYWMNSYLQLPPQLPDRLRAESRRVIGDVSNPYDAAIAVQQYLRGLTYSTRVPVPPADRDWVSFLVFQSKEGYCDYFATAMAVMLRTVGIPSRVASGYVTGDWDATTQSYVATEHHAHSWTEVYFPSYGWITFEPSANRPAPVRPETSPTPIFNDETITASSFDSNFEDFFEDDEDFGSSGPLVLPPVQSGPNLILVFGLLAVLLLLAGGGITSAVVMWRRGMSRLPIVARPFAQLVRLATWCGIGPRPSQTPYEYGRDLQRLVPAAGDRIGTLTDAYVAGIYGGKQSDSSAIATLVGFGAESRRLLIRAMAAGRWRTWIAGRLSGLAGLGDRRAP